VLCGLLHNPALATQAEAAAQLPGWLALATGTGLVFVVVFFLVGRGSQRIGVAYTAMLTKLSLVIPTVVAWAVFHDRMGPWRWAGIGLALVAVVLLHLRYFPRPNSPATTASGPNVRQVLPLAVALFLGAGLVDVLMGLSEELFGNRVPGQVHATVLFGAAGAAGFAVVVVQYLRRREHWFAGNLLAGLVLGIPNYFSIVFVLAGLSELDGTVFYPLNNIGQLVLATLAGVALYREPMAPSTWLGLLVAVGAVAVVALG
jgi:drug/metabolite transporter (DMT)-like permease